MADKGTGSRKSNKKKKADTSNKGKGRKKDKAVGELMRSSTNSKRVLNPRRHKGKHSKGTRKNQG